MKHIRLREKKILVVNSVTRQLQKTPPPQTKKQQFFLVCIVKQYMGKYSWKSVSGTNNSKTCKWIILCWTIHECFKPEN